MPSLLEELNAHQREAVTHTHGPLLIIAGPGSGKTRTVAHSIAYSIENGVLPDRVLAFSFTVKASEELKERVAEMLGKRKEDFDDNISTFHHFCRQVLKEDIDELQPNENRREEIIRKLTDTYKNQIDYIQNHKFPNVQTIFDFIEKCKTVETYETDERDLTSEERVDYESQLIFTDMLFSDVPEVRTGWQEEYDLIFVDEYQDTDPVQYRIIKALAEKHQNLRVVGDDDQGIYGFRGTDIQNILNFENDYPNAKIIPLGQNYRSTQEIVKVSKALADFNPDRRDKALFTNNVEGEKVKYLHCKTDEQEAATIACFIHRSISEGNWKPEDFAILYPTVKQAAAFRKALENFKIKYSHDRSLNSVSLMTIHQSKGLEFSNVFIVGICKGLLPDYYKKTKRYWGGEIRLLYVAMTRAKNWLCLSFYERDADHKRGKSPFLKNGYIPISLLEPVATLENTPIPPAPVAPGEYEHLPKEQFGLDMTVLGIDPGIRNVGWSITRKSSEGYTVVCGTWTSNTENWEDIVKETTNKVNALIDSHRPDAIAIEKLEGATEEQFLYVAGCLANIRNIASRHGIEFHLYTPQQVKYVATGKRDTFKKNRDEYKKEVQEGVRRICNLPHIPESDHAADAIAASLCCLRSYLNIARFEANKRQKEQCENGQAYFKENRYKAAASAFEEVIKIDRINTDAHYGLSRAYIGVGDLERAEEAAQKVIRLTENDHPDTQKLLDAIKSFRVGCEAQNDLDWKTAIEKFEKSIDLVPIFPKAYIALSTAYLGWGVVGAAEESLKRTRDYPLELIWKLSDAIEFYKKGYRHLRKKRYQAAIDRFNSCIKLVPNFTNAHCRLAQVYLKQGDLESAKDSIAQALKFYPDCPLAHKLREELAQAYSDRQV